jgi:hypothetical protein
MTTLLEGKDVLRTDTLTDEELDVILTTAAHFEEQLNLTMACLGWSCCVVW